MEVHACVEWGSSKGKVYQAETREPWVGGAKLPKAGTLFFKLHYLLPAIWLLRCTRRARAENKIPVSGPGNGKLSSVEVLKSVRLESIYSGDQHLRKCHTLKLKENVWLPNHHGSILDRVFNAPPKIH